MVGGVVGGCISPAPTCPTLRCSIQRPHPARQQRLDRLGFVFIGKAAREGVPPLFFGARGRVALGERQHATLGCGRVGHHQARWLAHAPLGSRSRRLGQQRQAHVSPCHEEPCQGGQDCNRQQRHGSHRRAAAWWGGRCCHSADAALAELSAALVMCLPASQGIGQHVGISMDLGGSGEQHSGEAIGGGALRRRRRWETCWVALCSGAQRFFPTLDNAFASAALRSHSREVASRLQPSLTNTIAPGSARAN